MVFLLILRKLSIACVSLPPHTILLGIHVCIAALLDATGCGMVVMSWHGFWLLWYGCGGVMDWWWDWGMLAVVVVVVWLLCGWSTGVVCLWCCCSTVYGCAIAVWYWYGCCVIEDCLNGCVLCSMVTQCFCGQVFNKDIVHPPLGTEPDINDTAQCFCRGEGGISHLL